MIGVMTQGEGWMRVALLLTMAALMSGCAQSERIPTAGPRPTYDIRCPAMDMRWCFARAREVCPVGYDIVEMNRPYNYLVPGMFPDRIRILCR
jgi:hypothetical protein